MIGAASPRLSWGLALPDGRSTPPAEDGKARHQSFTHPRYFDFAKSSTRPARQRSYAAGPSRFFAFLQAASIELRSPSLSPDKSGRAGSAAN